MLGGGEYLKGKHNEPLGKVLADLAKNDQYGYNELKNTLIEYFKNIKGVYTAAFNGNVKLKNNTDSVDITLDNVRDLANIAETAQYPIKFNDMKNPTKYTLLQQVTFKNLTDFTERLLKWLKENFYFDDKTFIYYENLLREYADDNKENIGFMMDIGTQIITDLANDKNNSVFHKILGEYKSVR
jgi:hypothetical protein